MRTFHMIGVAILSMIIASQASAADCQLQSYGALAVTPGEDDASSFPVTIGDRTFTAGFEPFFARSQVRPAVVEALGQDISSFHGFSTARFKQIVIAKALVESTDAIVQDPGKGPDLYLGRDVLHHFDLELDLGHDTIRLFSTEHCAGQVVYWAGEHYELSYKGSIFGGLFDAVVNGRKIKVVLAPNHLESDVEANLRDELGLIPDANNKLQLDTLEIGGIRLRHLSTGLWEHTINGSFAPDTLPEMLIGADVLKHMRVFIAQKEQKIYFTVADAS